MTREFTVLGAEMMRGNFSRIPGSLLVMNERLAQSGTGVLNLKNVLGGLGALGSVIFNPYILGFIAVSSAIELAVHAFGAFDAATVTASQALKTNQDAVNASIAGWKGLQQAAEQYTKAVEQFPIGASLIQLNQELTDASKRSADFLGYVKQLGPVLRGSLNSSDQLLGSYLDAFASGKEDVADLVTQLQGMKDSDLGGFNNLSVSLGPLHVGMKTMIDDLITMGQKTADDKNEMTALAAAIQSVGLANSLGQVNLDKLFTGDFDALAAGKSAATFKNSMAGVTAFSPSAKGRVAFNQSMASESGTGVSMARMLQDANQASTLAFTQASEAISRASQMQMLSANQAVAALKVQASTIGLSVGATAALTEKQSLLSAAEMAAAQNGVAVSAAQVAAIGKVSAAYGAATQKLAEMTSMSTAVFNSQMLGLNSTNQSIASAMRTEWGDAWASHMNDADAALMRLNATMLDFKNTAMQASTDALSTFNSDLQNGQGLWASFADAGVTALSDIAQKMEAMPIDAINASIFTAGPADARGILK